MNISFSDDELFYLLEITKRHLDMSYVCDSEEKESFKINTPDFYFILQKKIESLINEKA